MSILVVIVVANQVAPNLRARIQRICIVHDRTSRSTLHLHLWGLLRIVGQDNGQ